MQCSQTSDGAPQREKIEQIQRAMLSWEFTSSSRLDLTSVKTREFGSTRFSDLRGKACCASRAKPQQLLDDGSYVAVVCKLEGSERARLGHSDFALQSGDVAIWRNSAEMDFAVEDWSRSFIMLLPEVRFDAAVTSIERVQAWHLPGSDVIGGLISSFLAEIASKIDHLDDRSADLSAEMALDLISCAIRNREGDYSKDRQSLLSRILKFIEGNLQNSDLKPAEIAVCHGISTRYLHMIFARNGMTVRGWIRERRLLQCKEELELARRGLSLTEMAHQWGFCDAAHFSNLFKKRFGVSPTAYRHANTISCDTSTME